MNQKRIITFAGIGLLILLAAWGYSYFTTLRFVTVRFTNAHNVTIKNDTGTKTNSVSVSHSGQTVAIKKDQPYAVSYTGASGYADGSFQLSSSNTVTIDPDYSAERYQGMIAEAKPTFVQLLKSQYPNVENLYTISDGSMKNKGEWYATTLVFKGAYDFNSDTLRVLFHHDPTGWKLVTKPDILLNVYRYPDLPEDILSWTNSL